MLISSLQNPRVKQAIRLRTSRGRRQQQRIVVDGWREVSRALDGGVQLTDVFVEVERGQDPARIALAGRLAGSDVAVWEVTAAVFEKLCYGERGSGVVAVARTPLRRLNDWDASGARLIAVLEAVEKPGNVGAVLRSADAAGVDAVILADAASDLYNPNTIRASLGTVFTLPVFAEPAETVRSWLHRSGLPVFVARVDASVPYYQARLDAPCALVLGSEAHGASTVWSGADVTGIRLPMLGSVDSLNVSVTAAVLFYEALRQREQGK